MWVALSAVAKVSKMERQLVDMKVGSLDDEAVAELVAYLGYAWVE